MNVRWAEAIAAFLQAATPLSRKKECDPLKVRQALNNMSWEGVEASITCLDADIEGRILVFRAVDLSDDDAEDVMRIVIDRIFRSPLAKELGILETFRLVGLKRE